MNEREFAIDVVRVLKQAGFTALWAGGCVRDELLGLHPNDYDIATDATPEHVRKLFRRSLAIGAAFGVIEVIGPRNEAGEHLTVEVATFRADGSYSDGRRPDSVTFSSPQQDAQRRDFTINGLFFDPIAQQLHDYVGGQADLEARVLRAIGDPFARFQEDKLRVLRAVRIAARFHLNIDPQTRAAAKAMARHISAVSAERIAEELRKLLTHPNRAQGVTLLRELELLTPILPELVPTLTVPQGLPCAPRGTLWEHLVRVVELLEVAKSECTLEAAPVITFPLAFAALLHDVGKPRVLARTPNRYTFHGHEHVGRQMTEKIAARLKLSTAERNRLVWLVEKHQYLADAPVMRASRLKPILIHPGIGELLVLHRADALASDHSLDHVAFCEKMLRELPPDELNPPPILTGEDLIELGLKPGPEFRTLLDCVRESQLEGCFRSKDDAIAFVTTHRNAPGGGPQVP